MFIGQFFCPLVLLAAAAPLGDLSTAILALGVLTAVVAGFAPVIVRTSQRSSQAVTTPVS
jgi:hypothetical protein